MFVYERKAYLFFKEKSRLKEDAQKAKKNVEKHITAALKDIKTELPLLYDHLKEYIKKGQQCCYNPPLEYFDKWHIRY